MCLECDKIDRRRVLTAAAAVALIGVGTAAAKPPDAEAVQLTDAGSPVPGILFRASGRGRPVVLVAHGNPGFDSDYVEFCARVAAQDVNVLALDWAAGGPSFPAEEAARADWRRNTIGSSEFWGRGGRRYSMALQWLDREGIGCAGRLFAFGICGGGVVFGNWMVASPPLDGLVLFHAAARMQTERSASTPSRDLIDLSNHVGCPVQAHYGVLDQVARVSDARAYEAALLKAGKSAEFHYYPDAGHGFVLSGATFDASNGFGYVRLASERAIQRALAFAMRA